ncbi:50S ribosomal protein P1 [Candidatus Micrarchaeota archaeon]|nr:50S ribosomal protein P1 [Candidatus Micrarchaeota archaeon]
MEVDPYVHAALALRGLGKDVTKDNVVAMLKAVGGDVDDAKAKVLEDALKDVNWDEALKAPAMAAAPTAAPAAGGAAKEEAKEEASEEDDKKKEEEAAAGLANLFG